MICHNTTMSVGPTATTALETRFLPLEAAELGLRSSCGDAMSCSSATTSSVTSKVDTAWFCASCSYRNSDTYHTICALCGTSNNDCNSSMSGRKRPTPPTAVVSSCRQSPSTTTSTSSTTRVISTIKCNNNTKASAAAAAADNNQECSASTTTCDKWLATRPVKGRPSCETEDEEGSIQPPSLCHRASSSSPSTRLPLVRPMEDSSESSEQDSQDDDASISSAETTVRGSLTSSTNSSSKKFSNSLILESMEQEPRHKNLLQGSTRSLPPFSNNWDSTSASSPTASPRSRRHKVPHEDPVEQPRRSRRGSSEEFMMTTAATAASSSSSSLPPAAQDMTCHDPFWSSSTMEPQPSAAAPSCSMSVASSPLPRATWPSSPTPKAPTTCAASTVAATSTTSAVAGRKKKSLKDFIPGLRRRRQQRCAGSTAPKGPSRHDTEETLPMEAEEEEVVVVESKQMEQQEQPSAVELLRQHQQQHYLLHQQQQQMMEAHHHNHRLDLYQPSSRMVEAARFQI